MNRIEKTVTISVILVLFSMPGCNNEVNDLKEQLRTAEDAQRVAQEAAIEANEQADAANQRADVANEQADAANQRAAVAKKQADAANQRAAVAKKQADALDKKVAKGNISGVTVDHNKSVGGRKGMRINVTFSTANLKDCAVDCNAYFYLKSGSALRDQDGDYRTKSGNVSVGRTVTPKWKNTIYTNFDLFMPYGELHLGPGKWALKFSVSIFHAGDSLDRSNFRSFTYTK